MSDILLTEHRGHVTVLTLNRPEAMNSLDYDLYDALENAEGVMVVDRREAGGYTTPVECVGEDATFVSRVRVDETIPNGINMWVVSDNLRKGAALNAVQIAETLVQQFGLKPALETA